MKYQWNSTSKLYRKLIKTFPQEKQIKLKRYVKKCEGCLLGKDKFTPYALGLLENPDKYQFDNFEDLRKKVREDWNKDLSSRVSSMVL